MPHSSPFLYKSLDQLASNNTHPRSLSSTRGFQQCPAQTAHSEGAPSNMFAQTIPYALRAIQSREYPLLDRRRYEQDIKTLRAPAACNSRGLGRQWRVSDSNRWRPRHKHGKGASAVNTTIFVGLDVHALDKGRRPDAMTGEVRSATRPRRRSCRRMGASSTLPQLARVRRVTGFDLQRSSRRWASTAPSARVSKTIKPRPTGRERTTATTPNSSPGCFVGNVIEVWSRRRMRGGARPGARARRRKGTT